MSAPVGPIDTAPSCPISPHLPHPSRAKAASLRSRWSVPAAARARAIVGGLVLVAEGVAGVVDQANPCGLAAGLGLSNAGLGPAYILVAGGFRLVCGRLVCAGRVQGMGMGMGRRLSRVNGSARERRRFRSNLLQPFLPVAQLVEFHLQSHWVAVAVEPRAFVSVPLPRPS